MSAHTVKVYGASDDLIEIEGDVSNEIYGGEEPTYLLFSTGTQLKVWYGDEGVWHIETVEAGDVSKISCHKGVPDDTEEGGHGDPDASSYSDVVIIQPKGEIELIMSGSKQLKMPTKRDQQNRVRAKQVIDILNDRGGFDDWWYDIQQDDKNEILDEIAKLF